MSQAPMDLLVQNVREMVMSFEDSLYRDWGSGLDPNGRSTTFRAPQNFHNTLFNEYFTFDQLVAHLVFWIYKDFYIDNLPRKSFSELNNTKDIIDH